MMEITPLDVRKKKEDFTRGLRGYDPQEVDHFLDLVAERLEELVKINLALRERVDMLSERTRGQEDRERAVQEALITAQSLKQDIQEQARREAELIKREAEATAQRAKDGFRQIVQSRAQELSDLRRARSRFLKGFRSMLERELDMIEIAESNAPSDEFDLDELHFGRAPGSDGGPQQDSEGSEEKSSENGSSAATAEVEEEAAADSSEPSEVKGEAARVEGEGESPEPPPAEEASAEAETKAASGAKKASTSLPRS